MHFSSNLKYLRKQTGYTQADVSTQLQIGRTTIANYETGLSKPDIATLTKIADFFKLPIDELLYANLQNKGGNRKNGMPLVVTVDSNDQDNILFVPVKARAGYLLGYGDPEFVETLPSFRLPGLANGTYRMFEVEGLSMAPTLYPNDFVIGEWTGGLADIQNNELYVVVHEGGVLVKRVVENGGGLLLRSDNQANPVDYPDVQVAADDIRELWRARLKISAHLNP
jgi:transcriptional regulator with XRE-family HTH domain